MELLFARLELAHGFDPAHPAGAGYASPRYDPTLGRERIVRSNFVRFDHDSVVGDTQLKDFAGSIILAELNTPDAAADLVGDAPPGAGSPVLAIGDSWWRDRGSEGFQIRVIQPRRPHRETEAAVLGRKSDSG